MLGKNIESPNIIKKITARFLNISVEIPNAFARAKENTAKKVKLSIKPVITPRGLLFPPVNEPDRTIGNIGRIHGDKMVTIPAMKANKISTNISCILPHSLFLLHFQPQYITIIIWLESLSDY